MREKNEVRQQNETIPHPVSLIQDENDELLNREIAFPYSTSLSFLHV